MNDATYMAIFWRIAGSCPGYCPCRVLDRRGETPRNPERCPYEAAARDTDEQV